MLTIQIISLLCHLPRQAAVEIDRAGPVRHCGVVELRVFSQGLAFLCDDSVQYTLYYARIA